MEELKLEKTKKLKRKLGYAAKSAAKAGLRKVSPYAQKALAFMMLWSSGNISAEEINKYNENDNSVKTEQRISEDVKATDLLSAEAETLVFATLDECREVCGGEVNLDISQMEFSMADLELAKGKESETAVKMLNTALRSRTSAGHCTRNSKMTIRKMGWTANLSKEDKAVFEGIVPAWGLLPLLQAGKIGPLAEIRINPEELESKTTPIPLMRVNEAGETKNSHTQFMCPKGAIFGGGIQASPEYHKERGRRQKYGKAHFFGDKETIETVVEEVTKTRDDVLLVLNKKTKTASVVALDNVPQDYRMAVAQYRIQNQKSISDGISPADLATMTVVASQMPEDIKIMPLGNKKADEKAAKVYMAKNGLSKG